ncbi:MAG: hypothetical protein VCD00_09220, partial [Candidatus Hydrogenedentota bacterium]
ALLLLTELFVYARYSRDTFRLSENDRPMLEELYEYLYPEVRTLDVAGIDNAMRNHGVSVRRDVVWGYDPVVLDRYAEYVIFAAGNRSFDEDVRRFALWGNDPLTQGIHGPENYLTFTGTEPVQDFGLFTLLRTALLAVNSAVMGDRSHFLGIENAAPRFFLASEYQVHPDKDAMFEALGDTTIDLRTTVLLETAPAIESSQSLEPGDLASVEFTIVEKSTDHFIVEADVPHDSLLVMTDAYSSSWRATALDGSVQETYEILPAYWALRCIPVKAGHHRFRLEYRPAAYYIGLWTSCIATVVYLILVGLAIRRRGKKVSPEEV